MIPTKQTLSKLRNIVSHTWQRYCMDSSVTNWQKHIKASSNYNQVYTWLENHNQLVVNCDKFINQQTNN